MFALDAAQQQQHHVQVEQQRQLQQDHQAQQAKQEGSNVGVVQEEDEVGNNSMVEGVTSPPPSVVRSHEVDEPQNTDANIPVPPVVSVAVTTEHEGASRGNSNQPLFVNSNGQSQISSMLLNVHPTHAHFHHNNSGVTSTPVVSPLASPIASPQPSYQAPLIAASSTSSSSTSNSFLSRAPQSQVSWPLRSSALPTLPSNNPQELASGGAVLQRQPIHTYLQTQQSHQFPPLLHHSSHHLQQQHHPLPQILPQHPLQPSFNNPRTDPTVPPGCREHGFNLIGQKYLLHDQIEGSHLQRCIEVETQNEYVCKTVRNDPVGQAMFSAHMRVDGHPHINPVEEVIVGESLTYLIFPPCHVDLHSYVRMKRRLREPTARALFRQIVSAVHEAHSKGIVLRDLKLRKFVFTDETRSTLKLESLEDAVVLENEEHDLLSDKHGCPAYVSPEILRRDALYSGRAADMWGLGVMLYTMLVGRYPFHGQEHTGLFAKIRRGQFTIPDSISSRAKCLIRCLLRKDPEERLTTDDVLAHPWVTQHHTSSSSGSSSSSVLTPSNSVSSHHLQLNSTYAGNRHYAGNGAVAERSMNSSHRNRGMSNGSHGNSTTNSSQIPNSSQTVGSSTNLGLPTRPLQGSTPSTLSAVAAVASSSMASSFGIPPLVDHHNSMDQMVPESFHVGLQGVSEKY